MSDLDYNQQINFTVDKTNLYREVTFTDLKIASIRKLVPVTTDGIDDKNRKVIFVGSTQLMTPEGPLPIQARLSATTLEDAISEFPEAMKEALADVIEEIQRLQQEHQRQTRDDSRIIVPGR
jgi:hypothetical protein